MSQTRNRLPKRGRPLDSSPLNKTEKKHKDTEAETYCTICQEVILEGEEGQDAAFCEGQCQSWIHRKCSGLTVKRLRKSVSPMISTCVHIVCYQCKIVN